MTKALRVLAALALLALAAPAQAHVTVTVDPLAAPLVVGVPTNVTVHFSEPCFEVVPQQAQGQDTVMAGLAPGAPATFSWSGETVPFGMDQCDPTTVPLALVTATAMLTVTASADAPGLTNLTLPVTSYLGGGTTPGENVSLAITVAYHANGTLTAEQKPGSHASGQHGPILFVEVDYTTNADSLLSIEATATNGTVASIDDLAALPPAVANQTRGQLSYMPDFTPPEEWTSTTFTFKAFLAPKAGGPKVPVGEATLTIANSEADEHDEEHEHEESKDTPMPSFVLLAIALVALALRRR